MRHPAPWRVKPEAKDWHISNVVPALEVYDVYSPVPGMKRSTRYVVGLGAFAMANILPKMAVSVQY